MTSIEQQIEDAISKKKPEPIIKRRPRLIPPSDQKSKRPEHTQKGKTRDTKPEQSLKLFKERSDRVVKRLPHTHAEQLLLKASMKSLRKIATELKIEGLSNLRKNDVVLLILDKWRISTI